MNEFISKSKNIYSSDLNTLASLYEDTQNVIFYWMQVESNWNVLAYILFGVSGDEVYASFIQNSAHIHNYL